MGNFLCRIGLHRWRIARNTHVHIYKECRRCRHRIIVRVAWGGQPVDEQWLRTGKFVEIDFSKLKLPKQATYVMRPGRRG